MNESPCSVVVCDDKDGFRQLLSLILGLEPGITVLGEAANGREAIDQVRIHRPDVLLLDVAMPDMDGLEALPLLREEFPDTKVVMFSGFTNKDFKDRAAQLGACAYVEKGIDPADLAAAVRDACS